MNKKTFKLILITMITIIIITTVLLLYFLQETNNITDKYSEEKKILVKEEIKNFKLKRLIRQKDLILKKENFKQLSTYQKFVTPNNINIEEYVNTNNIDNSQEAYAYAINWVWVSDLTLNQDLEKWLLPADFIKNTPNYPTNPIPGRIASDCESQAYSLVSILENIGIAKENIRVVIGEVNFSGEIGGHAWVQIYENNEWFELEATSGPFWDDDDNKLVNNKGFPYNYFKNHPYPVIEPWAYFNDIYYYNPNNNEKSENLPNHWKQPQILFSN